jgi:hypothetical protein
LQGQEEIRQLKEKLEEEKAIQERMDEEIKGLQ